MPELPDVEGFLGVLAGHGVGRRVAQVEVCDAGVLRNSDAPALARALRGRRFRKADRQGKWLFARTDGPTVLFHFGMSGELRWADPGEPRHAHDRVIFVLDGGELRYRDQRKLQGLWLATDQSQVDAITGALGPDALGLSRRQFRERLEPRRGQIKATLMKQEVIAGLGNLLADEILWRARIHPGRRSGDLTEDDWARLHRALGRVLRESIRSARVPPKSSWLTGRRGREASTCPRCGTRLAVTRIGGRSTYSCPRCQPR
jgi:formamidopyrimidine-DNA glycosylase